MDAVAQQAFHQGRPDGAVADHIPDLFDALVALLHRTAPRSVATQAPLDDTAVLDAARQHARVRFEQGLSAADVVSEFRLLRQEIGRSLRAELDDEAPAGDVVGAEMIVHDALDGAISLGLAALTTHIEEMREEFLATTIHDVQQPITAIKGNVQLAVRALGRANADLNAVIGTLRRVETETARMSLLLGMLTDASRLKLGRLQPVPTPADLRTIAEQAVSSVDPSEAARVEIVAQDSATFDGQWDATMLSRVMVNLLSNALKYSPGDSPVQVKLEADSTAVRLLVADSGIGLAADELPRLFRRYGRVEGAIASGVQGLGLGLYLSRGIVEAHDGQIWAESPGIGLGTTIHVVLPRNSLARTETNLHQ